jgi:hypothetical protein
MTGPIVTGTGTGSSVNIASSPSSGSGNNVGRKGESRLDGGLVNEAASDMMYKLLMIIEPVPALTPTNLNPRPRARLELIRTYNPFNFSHFVHAP